MTPEAMERAVWSSGVKRTPDLTPERLEASAKMADQKVLDWAEFPKRAQEWANTAAQLRAKAADLRGDHMENDNGTQA